MEIFLGLIVAALAGVFVFALMMAIGPPPGMVCSNGKAHEYGNWEPCGYGQQRHCKVCGWRQLG